MELNERCVADEKPRYECLLFDLDDTLYAWSSEFAAAFTKNVGDYVVERLGVEKNKAADLCRQLYKEYGTVTAGLRAVGYEFDYDDYHSFVNEGFAYENLKPDPVLKNLLLSMPQRKIIFTNSDKVQAAKVLSILRLEDCFEGVICFETLNSQARGSENSNGLYTPDGKPKTPIVCKPSKEAIDQAICLADADPQRTIFFDDSPRNIAAAKRAGLHTVLVGTPICTEGADFALESIHNIKEALPEIWEKGKSSNNVCTHKKNIFN